MSTVEKTARIDALIAATDKGEGARLLAIEARLFELECQGPSIWTPTLRAMRNVLLDIVAKGSK